MYLSTCSVVSICAYTVPLYVPPVLRSAQSLHRAVVDDNTTS
jgi:hypothetical protein